MKARSKLPSVTDSPHPNRQNNVEVIAGILDLPNTRDQDFHTLCLRRDSYKCVVTGEMDNKYWVSLGRPEDIDSAPTVGAHIIPFSYASWERLPVIYSQYIDFYMLTNYRIPHMTVQKLGRYYIVAFLESDARPFLLRLSTTFLMA